MTQPKSELPESKKQHSSSGPNQSHSEREGWSAEELGEESSYEGTTELGRRLRRGDETAGDPDERDVAGDPGKRDD